MKAGIMHGRFRQLSKRMALSVFLLAVLLPALSPKAFAQQAADIDNAYYRLTVLEARWTGEGIEIRAEHENRTESPLQICRWDLAIDGVVTAQGKLGTRRLDACQTLGTVYTISRQTLIDLRLNDVHTVSVDITGGFEDELFRQTVSVPVVLPEGALPTPSAPLDTAVWRSMKVTLLAAEWRGEPPYRTLRFFFSLTNRGSTPVSLNAGALWLNGVGRSTVLNAVTDDTRAVIQPNGGFIIDPGQTMILSAWAEDRYIETGIDRVSLRLYETDRERRPGTGKIDFRLPETLRKPD